ncbi:MAG: hypothetical protein HKL92_10180 [Candidatus Eremiobacteraeota bacterium]|nr:hypothetical protein [Candidatus Eremiobacteraeota bacterium]
MAIGKAKIVANENHQLTTRAHMEIPMPKQKYSLEKVQTFGDYLGKLPKKSREKKTTDLGAADLVRTLRKEIRAAMARGYTVEEIVQAAKGQGFDLSTPTLKKYLKPGAATTKPKATDTKKNTTPEPKAQPSEKPGSKSKPIVIDPHEEL